MFTKTNIEKYFVAEKQESLLFVIFGIAAIVLALVGLFYWKTQFWKGASIPLNVQGIWITSNKDPRYWFPELDADTLAALFRRVNITHFDCL